MENETAKHFLSMGLQSWGQSDAERKQATDNYLKAAGFNLKTERKDAEDWLKGVIKTMSWGKFEREADHLAAALEARKAA
jgi:hypothetical protein